MAPRAVDTHPASGGQNTRRSYEAFDDALESLATAGPDLRNGLTNHAPMAVEALCAMGRGGAVISWLDCYRDQMMPWPDRGERIDRSEWRTALGHPERATDWRAFFANELEEAPWREVLDRWTARLAPALCASALHGVIRVGHAVRALSFAETRQRRQELADGLASWASTYQVLPTAPPATAAVLRPSAAIQSVATVPAEQRKFSGTIVGSLAALDQFPPFAAVISLARLDGDPAALISDLSGTFARVCLANARDLLGAIIFVHGVTGMEALRSMLPHLRDETAHEALRYAWQAGCALYAAFGHRPAPEHEIEPPRESIDSLIDMAIECGDEHAIKFTEACIRAHRLDSSVVHLSAARHAIDLLRR